MEHVVHAVSENHARLLPNQGHLKAVGPQAHLETLLVVMTWNPAPPLREGFGVAVLAAWANLVAPGNRIPGRVRPLDSRFLAHLPPLSFAGGTVQGLILEVRDPSPKSQV